jgi:hypothetical protein
MFAKVSWSCSVPETLFSVLDGFLLICLPKRVCEEVTSLLASANIGKMYSRTTVAAISGDISFLYGLIAPVDDLNLPLEVRCEFVIPEPLR